MAKHAVKEIVKPFAASKVVGRDGAVQRAFWRMRQHKDGQPVFLFEVVELYHQPSCRIALLHSTAQIGKIVNDENLAPGLQSHLFDTSHDGFLEIGFQQRIAVKRNPVQPFGKGVGLPMLVGIAELELLFGQFKIQIQHIVRPGDTVGYLHSKDGLAHIGIRKEAGQFPSYQKLSHNARGVGSSDASSIVRLAVLILITPMLSGIPCCTWVALVRSPCIRLI